MIDARDSDPMPDVTDLSAQRIRVEIRQQRVMRHARRRGQRVAHTRVRRLAACGETHLVGDALRADAMEIGGDGLRRVHGQREREREREREGERERVRE